MITVLIYNSEFVIIERSSQQYVIIMITEKEKGKRKVFKFFTYSKLRSKESRIDRNNKRQSNKGTGDGRQGNGRQGNGRQSNKGTTRMSRIRDKDLRNSCNS